MAESRITSAMGADVTLHMESGKQESTQDHRPNRAWQLSVVLVSASIMLGAIITLVVIWSIGARQATEHPVRAAFGSPTMTIVDQLGTVDVVVLITNTSQVKRSTTCAVIVTSGHGSNQYRGSAAFDATINPGVTRRWVKVVTDVYYDGDATAPIGSRYLPLPQYAQLGDNSTIECS